MYYKFISDMSIRRYCCVKARSLEEAIEKAHNDADWEQEPDEFPTYHRIEIANNEKEYEKGNYTEDEETEF